MAPELTGRIKIPSWPLSLKYELDTASVCNVAADEMKLKPSFVTLRTMQVSIVSDWPLLNAMPFWPTWPPL